MICYNFVNSLCNCGMKQLLLLSSLFLLLEMPLYGTSNVPCNSEKGNPIQADTTDTIIYRELQEIKVLPQNHRKLSERQYSRMEKKIRKVYPFAREAVHELELYNEKFKTIDDPRQKKQYVKRVEKELFARHEEDMKHLTISEGRYLLLLIDRETGNTSFELVKELKGSFSAAFWQGIAKIFKNNMKEEYDPVNKHRDIEQIVLKIEKENS